MKIINFQQVRPCILLIISLVFFAKIKKTKNTPSRFVKKYTRYTFNNKLTLYLRDKYINKVIIRIKILTINVGQLTKDYIVLIIKTRLNIKLNHYLQRNLQEHHLDSKIIKYSQKMS